MEIEKTRSESSLARIYIAACELKEFRGKKNVEIQLFRTGATQGELVALDADRLVGPPPQDMPESLLSGATKEAALKCLLEAFTEKESDELCAYLQARYAKQINKIMIAPINLPIPLGVGPLGMIPETASSGFINFDLAPGYDLGFTFRGYYDLAGSE